MALIEHILPSTASGSNIGNSKTRLYFLYSLFCKESQTKTGVVNILSETKKPYYVKLKGSKVKSGIPYPKLTEALSSGLGAFIAITILAYLTYEAKYTVLIAPLGASTFIVFAAPAVPFAQPRNVIGGQVIAALVGLTCYMLLGPSFWVAGLACGVATLLMVVTKTMHPPAGGTAIIPVLTYNTNWLWAFYPTGLGATIIVIVGILYNNLIKNRTYPAFWW